MSNRIFNKVKIQVDFDEAAKRENINTQEELPTLFGKIKKYFADMKTVAFTGKFSDLSTSKTDVGTPSKFGLSKLFTLSDANEARKKTSKEERDSAGYNAGPIDLSSTLSLYEELEQKIDEITDGTDEGLVSHNSSSSAHTDIRNLISGLTTRLNTLADSDDTTLDQLSEIVAYIKSNRDLIDAITTSKVSVSDIIDSLTSEATDKALAANQGKALKQLITDLASIVNGKVDKVTGKGLSTNDYTTAEKNRLSGIEAGAQVNIQSDWDESDENSDAYINNKPTIPPDTSKLCAELQSKIDEFIENCSFDFGTKNTITTKKHIVPSGNQELGAFSSLFNRIFVREISTGGALQYNTGKFWMSPTSDRSGYYGVSINCTSGSVGMSVGKGLIGATDTLRVSDCFTIGRFNSKKYTSSEDAFVIGSGTGFDDSSNNAFAVTYGGKVSANGISLTGADYAEYMEWKDKNKSNDDRVGRFVSLSGDKIVLANEGDYIIGIVSANPSIIGNNDFDQWSKRYLRDDLGRLILGDVETINDSPNDDGEPEVVIYTNQPQLNPEWDATQTYVSRKDRPEWDTVGMLGVLRVYDDGTCEEGTWCKVYKDGLATKADLEDHSFLTPIFYVMKRVTDEIIEVFFK